MTVHVLLPVFNRLAFTRQVLDCLRTQEVDESLNLIVIDDGSTDGTAEFLNFQKDVCVLKGDSSLWWAGAIEVGLQRLLEEGDSKDWVLLINNDTHFAVDFIQRLVDIARYQAPAVIGSIICNEAAPDQLLSIGAVIDTWTLKVRDRLAETRLQNLGNSIHSVDALSGRGTLYPLVAFRIAGTMKPFWIPHYFADYELSVRVSKAGFKLLVTEDAAIFSSHVFGNSYYPTRLRDKFLSIRSAYYLPAVIAFWWCISSPLERLTLMPRMIYKGFKGSKPHS